MVLDPPYRPDRDSQKFADNPVSKSVSQDSDLEQSSGYLRLLRRGRYTLAKINHLKNSSSLFFNRMDRLIVSLHTQHVFNKRRIKTLRAITTRAVYDLGKIWAKSYFGYDLVTDLNEDVIGIKNIANRNFILNEKHYQSILQLLDVCEKLKHQGELAHICATPYHVPHSLINDGISDGIRLDIAHRYLTQRESLISIIKSHQNESSSEAAANQVIYEIVKPIPKTKGLFFRDLFNYLQDIAASEGGHELFYTDFESIGQAFTLIIHNQYSATNAHLEYVEIYERYLPLTQAYPDNSLPYFVCKLLCIDYSQQSDIHPLKKEELKDLIGLERVIFNQIYQHFHRIMQSHPFYYDIFSEQRKDMIKALYWLMALLQLNQSIEESSIEEIDTSDAQIESIGCLLGKELEQKATQIFGVHDGWKLSHLGHIAHPHIRVFIKMFYDRDGHTRSYQAIAQARGLKLASVASIMGDSAMHHDESYLSNLEKLPNGVYAVDIMTEKGRHAITYIKESSEIGYILDPYGYAIACQDSTHTLEQFHKLLSLYSSSKDKHIFYSYDIQDHEIHMMRIDLIVPLMLFE